MNAITQLSECRKSVRKSITAHKPFKTFGVSLAQTGLDVDAFSDRINFNEQPRFQPSNGDVRHEVVAHGLTFRLLLLVASKLLSSGRHGVAQRYIDGMLNHALLSSAINLDVRETTGFNFSQVYALIQNSVLEERLDFAELTKNLLDELGMVANDDILGLSNCVKKKTSRESVKHTGQRSSSEFRVGCARANREHKSAGPEGLTPKPHKNRISKKLSAISLDAPNHSHSAISVEPSLFIRPLQSAIDVPPSPSQTSYTMLGPPTHSSRGLDFGTDGHQPHPADLDHEGQPNFRRGSGRQTNIHTSSQQSTATPTSVCLFRRASGDTLENQEPEENELDEDGDESEESLESRAAKACSVIYKDAVPGDYSNYDTLGMEYMDLETPSHRFMVAPNCASRLSWDIAAMVIILIEAAVLPYLVAFEVSPTGFLAVSIVLSTVFFFVDIPFNFITGCWQDDALVMNQFAVAKRYICSWFALDLFSAFPWELLFDDSPVTDNAQVLRFLKISKVAKLFRLLRLFKLKAIYVALEEAATKVDVVLVLPVIKYTLSFLYFAHWLACGFAAIGMPSPAEAMSEYDILSCEPDGPCEGGIGTAHGSPWIKRYGLIGSPAASLYLIAAQTAVGMVLGDDQPVKAGTTAERCFCLWAMLSGFCISSFILSHIVVALDESSREKAEYLEHSRAIKEYMVARSMPAVLQTKVKQYLMYTYEHRKLIHQSHDVMNRLSPMLRLEIVCFMNRSTIIKHPFFNDMQQVALGEVCGLCRSLVCAPGDYIFRKGTVGASIVFSVRGNLRFDIPSVPVRLQLAPPRFLGDRELFVPGPRSHDVSCIVHAELLVITQEDLLQVSATAPEINEYFNRYRQRVMDGDLETVYCNYCKRFGHELDNCVMVERDFLRKTGSVPASMWNKIRGTRIGESIVMTTGRWASGKSSVRTTVPRFTETVTQQFSMVHTVSQ